MNNNIGEYEHDYKIMVVTDFLKEKGYKWGDYEDMYEEVYNTLKKWELWDIKNKKENTMSWLCSLNEFINNN